MLGLMVTQYCIFEENCGICLVNSVLDTRKNLTEYFLQYFGKDHWAPPWHMYTYLCSICTGIAFLIGSKNGKISTRTRATSIV